MIFRRGISVLVAVFVALAFAGCATVIPRNGIPDAKIAQAAAVDGMPGVRVWGDEIPANIDAMISRQSSHLPRLGQTTRYVDGRPVVETLALSGGGGDGAFGAGLLAGWSKRGDRPQFEVVTGVSAGALIAPFAFLGPRYDHQLQEIWTQYQTNEIAIQQLLPGLLGGPALADTGPLVKLIEHYIDAPLLRRVAVEYKKGRLLLIGTTNLDAQRQVIWNMGAIAQSNHPEALDLFRKVMLASAAIPGAFPPVHIEVDADGQHFDELHVDGGTTHEVFIAPLQVPLKAFDKLYPAPPIRKIYVIKNGKIGPEQAVVQPQALSIAARAIATLLKNQHQGDIYRIYRMARDAGADFNLLSVPDDFSVASSGGLYDPAYQKALFDEGYRIGRRGGPWLKAPPVRRTVATR